LRGKIDFAEAALIEPLSVVCHAIFDICRIEPDHFVSIIGPGPIGLLAAEVARASGSNRILISGIQIDKERLELARRLGFKTISSTETDSVKETLNSTNGIGADVAIVAAGSGLALVNACDMVKKGGKVLSIGIFSKPVELNITSLVRRQISLCGTFASSWKNYEEAMNLVEYGKVDLKPLITHHFPINDATAAFEIAKSKEGCKVQITM
jgi:L-iditol 2-dehydrogenase